MKSVPYPTPVSAFKSSSPMPESWRYFNSPMPCRLNLIKINCLLSFRISFLPNYRLLQLLNLLFWQLCYWHPGDHHITSRPVANLRLIVSKNNLILQSIAALHSVMCRYVATVTRDSFMSLLTRRFRVSMAIVLCVWALGYSAVLLYQFSFILRLFLEAVFS